MVGVRVALNQTQKISTFPVIARLVSTATSWYTCPANRKAHVKGYVIPDNFGAGTKLHVELNPTGGDQISEDNSVADTRTDAELDMVAGDVLGYDQDIGSNATVDGVWVIQETRA